jgi:K+-transporting ATPase c subunit
MLLGACSRSEVSQSGNGLKSDIPARSAEYQLAHPSEATAIQMMCSEWKGSQRPIASWPAVVTENCNNNDTARMLQLEDERREKLKRQAGI